MNPAQTSLNQRLRVLSTSLGPRTATTRNSFSTGSLRYFEEITENIDSWTRKTRTYLKHTTQFLQKVIPPGKKVLIFGCPDRRLLDNLAPSRGVGVHLSKNLVKRFQAENVNPRLEFSAMPPESLPMTETFDYVVLLNQTEYSEDVLALLQSVRRFLNPESVLILSRINPIWHPIVKLASRFGVRVRDYRRNFFSNELIQDCLGSKGFRYQGEYNRVLIPKGSGRLIDWFNTFLGRLPFVHRFCFLKYTFAKLAPASSREELSCSVLIPCYNEEGNVRECATRVPQMGKHTEVIIIDDGSKDRTAEIAEELTKEYSHIRFIKCPKNQGKGKAVFQGLRESKGDLVFILDADMTVQPEELPDFYDAVSFGAADFVSGTRFVYPMENKAMRVSNYIGNILFSILVQTIIGTRCTDTLCGTKVMRRKTFSDFELQDKSWGDFDFIFHAARKKQKSIQIPVHYKNRVAGQSKMKAFSAGIRFLKYCLTQWPNVS